MATFTITANRNFDSSDFASRAGNDIYNVNGAVLTIDTDTRYCKNSDASKGNLGALNLHANLGGSLLIDGRNVRLIAFDAGVGSELIPAIGDTIVGATSGATGEVLGVWTALNVPPTTAGGGVFMPSTGYIKFKNKTGNFQDNEAIQKSAVTIATANGVDRVGWIEVVGIEGQMITCPFLGRVEMFGEWFEVGTTNGAANQTFQLPACLTLTMWPGIFLEKTVGSPGATEDFEFIPFVGYNTTTQVHPIAGVAIGTHAVTNRVVWIDNQGALRIGNNGSADVGFVPVMGLRIVVPNIVLICATSGAPTVNSVNATPTTRYKFYNQSFGDGEFDKVNFGSWQFLPSLGNTVDVENCMFGETVGCSTFTGQVSIRHSGCAGHNNQYTFGRNAGDFTGCIAGIELDNFVFSKKETTSAFGSIIAIVSACKEVVITNCKFGYSLNKQNAQAVLEIRNSSTISVEDVCMVGGAITLSTCNDFVVRSITLYQYVDFPIYLISTGYGITCELGCTDGIIEDIIVPEWWNCPSATLFLLSTKCARIKIRNVGSKSTPLPAQGPLTAATFTRSSAVQTITKTGHKLATGAVIIPIYSDGVGQHILGSSERTVTRIDDNTFTVPCSSTGLTSGSISYQVRLLSLGMMSMPSGSTHEDITLQRVFVDCFGSQWAGDRISPNLVVEDVGSLAVNSGSTSLPMGNNGKIRAIRGLGGTGFSNNMVGVHVMDGWSNLNSPNKTGCTFSRSSATVTVTSVAHKQRIHEANASLRSWIMVTRTDDEVALPLGCHYVNRVVDADTFEITGLSGSVTAGPLTMDYVDVTGRLNFIASFPTDETASQITLGGSPLPPFTGAGLYLATVGQEVIFETPRYITGHREFVPVEMGITDRSFSFINYFYKIDLNDGNGFSSSWKNARLIKDSCNCTIGSPVVTFTASPSSEQPQVGDYVTFSTVGLYFPGFTKIISVGSGTFTTDKNAIANGAGISLNFMHLPSEVINPALGFKLQLRAICHTANTTGIATLVLRTISTDSEINAVEFPLDESPIEVTNVIAGSRIKIVKTSDNTILVNESCPGTTFTTTVEYTGEVRIEVRKATPPGPYYKPFVTIATVGEGVSVTALQQLDE